MAFVAFEGGEASGKSTQAARLAARLGVRLTREPGGTDLGERLRSLLLESPAPVDARAEALLMAAARAQHVAEVIRPELEAGRHVVTDRFTGSSLAYQGAGRGLGEEAVAAISRFATEGLEPDVTVLLTVPADQAAARRRGTTPDRIESAGAAFHEAVAAAYERLAAADDRWVVIDGAADPDEVAAAVWRALQERLDG